MESLKEVKAMALLNSKTYKRLSSGLYRNCGKEGFEVLLDLTHSEYCYCKDDDVELQRLKEEYIICEENWLYQYDLQFIHLTYLNTTEEILLISLLVLNVLNILLFMKILEINTQIFI